MISESNGLDDNVRTSVIGFLSHLTTDELRSVDDARLDELLKDVKQGNDRETEKEMLLASNRSLAEYNLSMEPILASQKNDLLKCYKEGEEWYNKVSEKYEKMMTMIGHNKLDGKLSVLQLRTAEIEEDSEKIAEKFLSGESEVDDFIEQFISQRKLMHLNKVKTDKLNEMIRHRNNMDGRRNQDIRNQSNMNGYPSSVH